MVSIMYSSEYDMSVVFFTDEDGVVYGFNYYWTEVLSVNFLKTPDKGLTEYLLSITSQWSRHWSLWGDRVCELIQTYLNEVRPVPIPQGFNESLRKVIKNWLENTTEESEEINFIRHDMMTWCALLENPMSVHISQTGIESFCTRNEFGVDFPEFVHNKNTDK